MQFTLPKKLKPPYLIHSDTIWTLKYIKELIKNNDNYGELHLDLLSNLFGQNNLIFPSFNYEFPNSKYYNVQETKSDVGYLSNYLISKKKYKRTDTPIFSFLTNIKSLYEKSISKPFNELSVFDFLFQNDGTIIFYGTSAKSCTYLHYVESQSGNPVYRYYKDFSGEVVNNNQRKKIKATFHVRPKGMNLIYDFDKLNNSLTSSNKLYFFDSNFTAIRARDLSDIWSKMLLNDKFFFLSGKCKIKIKNNYEELGRPFRISDFE